MSIADAVVLAVNAGSSSLKCGLYAHEGHALWTGTYEGLEPGGTPRLNIDGQSSALEGDGDGFDAALGHLCRFLESHPQRLAAVAHRIVHGGDRFVAPVRLEPAVLEHLETLSPLAPLHQPHNLEGVRAFQRLLPAVPQIGCFDTAFHATLPDEEWRLPIARDLVGQGIRRYGFHGLSYQYVSGALAGCTPRAAGRVVMAHLGSGSSACAMQGGRSVATTMGFSALEGLMMGTRSGSIDPGVLLHLWRQGWTLAQVEELLYKRSGLKGVSGLSADMRTLRASTAPEAQQAIALYTQRVRREAGALTAVMGGLDVIAFTGGIGEHDGRLRADVCASLAFLGLQLDPAANAAATGADVVPVHAPGSTVEAWVVPTDEGRVAARSAFAIVESS